MKILLTNNYFNLPFCLCSRHHWIECLFNRMLSWCFFIYLRHWFNFKHSWYDKVGHVVLIYFGVIAKDHRHFEVEANGRQMVY